MRIVPKKTKEQFVFSGARQPRIVRRGADVYDPNTQTYKEGRGKDYGSVQNPSGIDHGSLAGLTDDDHTQYLLADGSRALSATIIFSEAANITVGTTTGTKIGTSTSQKLGFFNATPIVQPVGTTDLRTALINLGLYASGGASPLNLNGGAFTCAALTATTIGCTTITITDASNIVLGTTTGTKIGTATNQKIGFLNAAPVAQQTDGAGLTNNVTSGGTTDTIADFTDLTVYLNDSSAIRNNFYQLARKVKIIGDALRTYGLLS